MQGVTEGLSVGAGAALGACARLGLTLLLGAGMWPILAINILGSFIMGWRRPGPFWGTGFLGGFTTFSAFAVLLYDAPLPQSAMYLAGTALGCTLAWLLGDRCAK